MKNILFTILTAIISCTLASLTGCDSFSKPYLSLNDNQPYILTISDFSWSYGTTQVNKFNGDFETLDRKVFNLLHNKKGSCYVVMNIAHVTKYGQSKGDTSTIGMIDLSELNRYQSWEYWYKSGGIQKLLYNYLFPPLKMADSASSNTNAISHYDTIIRSLPSSAHQSIRTYSFTVDQLNPRADGSTEIDSSWIKIDGVITSVDSIAGTIIVEKDDGSLNTVYYIPEKASARTVNRLKDAVQNGNIIRSVCSPSGASFELMSATITKKQ
jgi:hypothetical protein